MPSRSAARFWLLCACTFFHFLAMGVFLSGLPLFVNRELGASKAAVGFTLGSFSLTAVFLRPLIGRRIDRWGRIWFVRGAPVLVAATAIGLMFAHSLGAVIALRMAQGLAGAAFYTGAATIATDLAPAPRRAEYIARFSVFLYAGFAAGPALGEALIVHKSYNAAWLGATAAAIVAAAIAMLLRESLSMDEVVVVPPHPPKADQTRAPRARFRFVHPAALGPGLVLMSIAVGYTAISSFAPLYARSIGMGSSGGLYITFALTILVVRLVSGRTSDRFGRAAIALPGLVSAASGMALIAAWQSPTAAFIGVALFGAGHALIFPALMALTVDRVPERERGEALGSFTACFDLGASIGGYLVGFIADKAGFRAAWATPGLLSALGIVALLLFVRPGERADRAAAAAAATRAGPGAGPDLEPAGT
jgi:MFS family permease